MKQRLTMLIPILVFCVQPLSVAHADKEIDVTPDVPTQPDAPEVVVGGVTEVGPEVGGGGTAPITSDPSVQVTYEYMWLLSCFDNVPGEEVNDCPAAHSCASDRDLRWTLWARQLTQVDGGQVPDAEWEPILTECHSTRPAAPEAPQPQVTDALVLREVERLGLPRLTVQVQPAGETLVNFETIFYTEAPQWARTVQLLGSTVDVEAHPNGYDWRFGDGASASTQMPGAPYPAKDITHTYSDAHVTVAPRVDTAYEVRYRVNGGGWSTIAETVPAAGLPVDLRIREATAVLVGAD